MASGEIKHEELAICEAPRCGWCEQPMHGHGATEWACGNVNCTALGRPVAVPGLYPFYNVIKAAAPSFNDEEGSDD